jgi:hypothetical protein
VLGCGEVDGGEEPAGDGGVHVRVMVNGGGSKREGVAC